MAQKGGPDFQRDGADWPNRDASQFVRVGAVIWHTQRVGQGTPTLLIHGTGAGTHSWAGLISHLAETHDLLAVDLPGHGFTQVSRHFRPTIDNMASAVEALCLGLSFKPELIIAHSAGTAIAIRMANRGQVHPERIVSINGALRPYPGLLAPLATGAARLLTAGGLAASMLANGARDIRRVERLLTQTGSHPSKDMISYYGALLRHPAHVSGTLSMMAHWDLSPMPANCARLSIPILFLAGADDLTVPPGDAIDHARGTSLGIAKSLEALGHFAHEEDPSRIAEEILAFEARPI
ncbi:MAG: alpha/beta fold hydrolase BchO, partial [Pseudomonadota bacterium]